jgi:hypothetical protein
MARTGEAVTPAVMDRGLLMGIGDVGAQISARNARGSKTRKFARWRGWIAFPVFRTFPADGWPTIRSRILGGWARYRATFSRLTGSAGISRLR